MPARASKFDAYHKWLGIPPAEQPPNHYRLLGIALLEGDEEVIGAAADRQMAHVKSFATGRYATESQRLLNELARARVVLLNEQKKAVYDKRIGAENRESPQRVENSRPAFDVAPPPLGQESSELAQIAIAERRNQRQINVRMRRKRRTFPFYTICIGFVVIAASLVIAHLTRPQNTVEVHNPAHQAASGVTKGDATLLVPKSDAEKRRPTTTPQPRRPPPLARPAPHSARLNVQPEALDDATETRPSNHISPSEQEHPRIDDLSGKAPQPEEEELQEARRIIAEVYLQDFERLRSTSDKVRLARRLLDEAKETESDPPAAFALCTEALQLATDAAEPSLAFEIARHVEEKFDGPPLFCRSQVAIGLSETARSSRASTQLCEEVRPLLDEAIKRDLYEAGQSISQVFVEAARRSHRKDLLEQATAALGRVTTLRECYGEIEPALAVLDLDEQNPLANLEVGKFYAIVKGDWSRGLPCLARGADSALRQAAARELAAPGEPLAIADLWYALSEDLPQIESKAARRHAIDYYRIAALSLQGLDQSHAIAAIQSAIDDQVVIAQQLPLTDVPSFEIQGVRVPAAAIQYDVVSMPPPTAGTAEISFRLDRRFRRFAGSAWIKPNEQNRYVSCLVRFEVRCDGRPIWRPDPFDEQGREKRFNLDVEGVEVLTLVVEGIGDRGRDFAFAEWKTPLLIE
ncbi:MAG: NPCBM/NEW2 domain-containing protein [Planctomycetales bacterium]|nr:NPCBM/NEW2 domain-containing protein [Planctomycetales bacterium]